MTRSVFAVREECARLKEAGLWPGEAPPGVDPRAWAIMAMCAEGATCAATARVFGVTGQRVQQLVAGESMGKAIWWHLHGRFARSVYSRSADKLYRQRLK